MALKSRNWCRHFKVTVLIASTANPPERSFQVLSLTFSFPDIKLNPVFKIKIYVFIHLNSGELRAI